MLEYLINFSPADLIPLDRDIYLRMIERLNGDLWPLQVVLIPFILSLPLMRFRQHKIATHIALAGLWLLVGWHFHANYLAELLWFAHYFAYAFYLQVLLWAASAIKTYLKGVQPMRAGAMSYYAGWSLIVCSVIFLPLVNAWEANSWASAGLPGFTPTPTVLLSFGIILLQSDKTWWLLPIPFFWVCANMFISHALALSTGYILLLGTLIFIAILLKDYFRRRFAP